MGKFRFTILMNLNSSMLLKVILEVVLVCNLIQNTNTWLLEVQMDV
jgi:hypothetical protein